MFHAGTIGEDKAVETVEPVFRIAACPGAARGPGAERRELWVRGSERLHGVRVLARRGKQQLIKALRRRYRKDRGIDHSATPFLPVRCRDLQSHAPHSDRRIRRIRISGTEIEASEGRILTAGEDLGM